MADIGRSGGGGGGNSQTHTHTAWQKKSLTLQILPKIIQDYGSCIKLIRLMLFLAIWL
jgi:hypothetical protein